MSEEIRVLHVDDDMGLLELAAIYLERHQPNLSVVTESDPERALDRLDSENIDCVVSDYDMPNMVGLDLLKSVRDRYPDCPFVLFTGKGSEEIASKAISAGVTDYLQKEVGTDQYAVLANRIENAVAKRRAEQVLSEREARFEALIENTTDLVTILDESGTIRYESPSIERVLGYGQSELVGEDAFEYIHPDDRSDAMAVFTETVFDDELVTGTAEFRFKAADGSWRYLEAIGSNRRDTPAIEGYVINSRDVTERRRIGDQLREREEMYRTVVEQSQDAIFVSQDRELVFVNEKATDFTGYSKAELREISVFDLAHPDDRGRLREIVVQRERGADAPTSYELRLVRKDGEVRPYRLSVKGITYRNEYAVLGTVRELSRD